MVPISSRFSGTSAMPSITRSSSDGALMDWPWNSIEPCAGSTPIRALSSVDLPAPLGPIVAPFGGVKQSGFVHLS
jgi:hypothetical protein